MYRPPPQYPDRYAPEERFVLWPPDERAANAEASLREFEERHARPLSPLTSEVEAYNRANPHDMRAINRVHRDPSHASLLFDDARRLARQEWLQEPDPQPYYHRLRASNNLAEVPEGFRSMHRSFPAPFGSTEWQDLVNWRRREAERGRPLLPESQSPDQDAELLGHYINWAEEAVQRPKGREAYHKWRTAIPESDSERTHRLWKGACHVGAAPPPMSTPFLRSHKRRQEEEEEELERARRMIMRSSPSSN
jgi:hypothetical protein